LEEALAQVNSLAMDQAAAAIAQAQAEVPEATGAAKRGRAGATAADALRDNALADIAFMRLYAAFISLSVDIAEPSEQALRAAQQAGRQDLQAGIWAIRGYRFGRDDRIDEQLDGVQRALDLAGENDHLAHVWAHLALAGTLQWLGDFDRTAHHYQPAVQHARASGDVTLQALALRHMMVIQAKEAFAACEAGSATPTLLQHAESGLRESIHFYLQKTTRRQLSFIWLWLAENLILQGRLEEALALQDEHLPQARAMGLRVQAAEAGARRAGALLQLGRPAEALRAMEQALQDLGDIADPEVRATVHRAHAQALRAQPTPRADEAAQADAAEQSALAARQAQRSRYLGSVQEASDRIHAALARADGA
jgi:tetratricopeptide (TPR) repeat protein